MRSNIIAVAAALILSMTAASAAATPFPDPPPGAQAKATVSGSYWVDVNLYVDDQLVHGAKGRCHYRAHHPRRCFVIRVRVR